MKTFIVNLVANVPVEASVEVEADTLDEAFDKVELALSNGSLEVDWEQYDECQDIDIINGEEVDGDA